MANRQELDVENNESNPLVSHGEDYSYWERNRTKILVLVSLFAFLGPISSTIYLPSLAGIEDELNTTEFMAMLTISPYFIILGLVPMVYGPMSDRYGRKKVILFGLLINLATSISCGFAWNIESLIAFRSLQALGVGSLLVVGAGVITDIYPMQLRANALGMFTIAPSVGPLFGPSIGGLISEELSWRWVFFISAMVSGVFAILCIIFLPETLSPSVVKRPLNPLKSLKFLLNPAIFITAMANGMCFSLMTATLARLPLVLEDEFGLSEMITGFCYLPYAIAALISSKIGGPVADWGQRNFGYSGRIFSTIAGVLFQSLFSVLFSMARDIQLVLVALTFTGFFFSFQRPGAFAFAIQQYNSSLASSISSSFLALQYTLGFLSTLLGPLFWDTIEGEFIFFLSVASITCFVNIFVIILCGLSWRKSEAVKFECVEL
eukprot:TRINITY_DN1135_c0_g3_i1.p1 TRINITY_DN1135_c0_g3~~TRINITY_DN1135_c0_g3_i1.p1  ORF type:complete len:435 (-),score=37.54 TRINITY_DN1135_c0_g3_i1:24-1328(-)